MWCGVTEKIRWFYLIYRRAYGRLVQVPTVAFLLVWILSRFWRVKGFRRPVLFRNISKHAVSSRFRQHRQGVLWSARPASCFHVLAELVGGAVAVLSV